MGDRASGRRTRVVGAAVAASIVAGIAVWSLLRTGHGGGEAEEDPYEAVAGWPESPCAEGYQFGSTAGIFAESPDRVFILQRGCLPALTDDADGRDAGGMPRRNASRYDLSRQDERLRPQWSHVLYVVNRDGKVIESWTQHNHLFVRPHRVVISPYDPDRHVWVVDEGSHQITKLTNDGERVVLQVGELNVPGDDERHFARPTDIAWLPDGTFFVSDGYTNSRVVKLDPSGRFLMQWGKKGVPPHETRPGYMNTVHSVAVDAQRRVYVGDRANSRIQVFDENGVFLGAWPSIEKPYHLYIASDQHVWVADGSTQRISKLSPSGDILYAWGRFGSQPGAHWGPHQLSVDSDGALYTADVHLGRPQKLRPRPGVDPSKLIGQPMGR